MVHEKQDILGHGNAEKKQGFSHISIPLQKVYITGGQMAIEKLVLSDDLKLPGNLPGNQKNASIVLSSLHVQLARALTGRSTGTLAFVPHTIAKLINLKYWHRQN